MYEELLKNFDPITKKNIHTQLSKNYDQNTKNEIITILKKDPNSLIPAFYKNLDFGTGGIRALMGIGTNRVNIYTIKTASQALANYIKKLSIKTPSIIIGYDNRNNSKLFASTAAKVLAFNNIKIFLFKNLRPTPIVSFGIREKNCTMGIMITASHNSKEYNGFKVYWKDGAQVLPPHDKNIIEEVKKIEDPSSIKETEISNPLIEIIDTKVDERYIEKLESFSENFKITKDKKSLKILYTNLHGTGITMIPKVLENFGFSINYVEKQKTIDSNFTYAPSPNPEEKEALKLGIDDLKNNDILIATDPDADRMGVVVNHKNNPVILTGNQISCILLDYILKNINVEKSATIKTIVTTNLFKEISSYYKSKCFDVLTGFKYIAEKIENFKKDNSYNFVFGAEESYGYLIGDFVRDKDSISASLFISVIANIAKLENKTLIDLLYDIYKKYGLFLESLFSLKFEDSKKGMEKRDKIMENIRNNPPSLIANLEILKIEDYKEKISKDLKTKKIEKLTLPKSNVLKYTLSDNSYFVIRPSGTEPKIKIYLGVSEKNIENIEDAIKLCKKRLEALTKFIKNILL